MNNHNHYDYNIDLTTGNIKLVWIDADKGTSDTLCEIPSATFDPDGGNVSELVEYAHRHGLIEFNLRRELENMGFCDMGGSTRAIMFECRMAQIWIEPEMLVLVATKTSAIGNNLDVPATYEDFQPIRDKILELIDQPQSIER